MINDMYNKLFPGVKLMIESHPYITMFFGIALLIILMISLDKMQKDKVND